MSEVSSLGRSRLVCRESVKRRDRSERSEKWIEGDRFHMIYPAGGHFNSLFLLLFFSRLTSLCILIHNRIAETRHASFLFSIIIFLLSGAFLWYGPIKSAVKSDRIDLHAGQAGIRIQSSALRGSDQRGQG